MLVVLAFCDRKTQRSGELGPKLDTGKVHNVSMGLFRYTLLFLLAVALFICLVGCCCSLFGERAPTFGNFSMWGLVMSRPRSRLRTRSPHGRFHLLCFSKLLLLCYLLLMHSPQQNEPHPPPLAGCLLFSDRARGFLADDIESQHVYRYGRTRTRLLKPRRAK